MCEIIAVRKCHMQLNAVCLVHSSLLAWISSVHTDKVLAYLRFKKVFVLKASFSKTFLQIDSKGLDSSNNIDSRINITTFFNFPDMFRRYIRHLQCYIFEIAVEFKARAILQSNFVRSRASGKLKKVVMFIRLSTNY